MTPTNKLRFLKRPMTIYVNDNYGETEFVKVLQQWWENNMTINLGWTGDMPLGKTNGEWRDVPVEVEA